MTNLVAYWHKSMDEIPRFYWEDLLSTNTNPFFCWDWLNALEKSESVCPQTGWQPMHLSIWRNERPIGFAPLYLKNHSYGEFIFDHLFAQLASKLRLNYYPKLIGMSPLSPIEGYKFIIDRDEKEKEITNLMLSIIDDFASNNNILSCNFLYVDSKWGAVAQDSRYLTWINQQSMWSSQGESNFDDYLKNFNANQRRNIKRERKSIKEKGLEVSAITNDLIDKELLDLVHTFYEMHCSKWGMWGSKYLSQNFFHQLCDLESKKNIVIFSAHRGNPKEPIAMSFCMRNEKMLWGRYWGAKEEIDALHFEVCYYAPIAWCIENGIDAFDPGAGGSHKRRRGFLATPRTSLHKWYDIQMHSLLKDWLEEVNTHNRYEINTSNNEAPFKH